jgi:manganese transport protein
MNKWLEILLGILTAMGGFVEIGELVFTVNAGAKFGYHLLWVVLLGTIGIIVYGEMAGRIAAVAHKPVFLVMRERLSYKTALGSLIAATIVNLMTCAAEVGGIALILKYLFGGNYFLLIVVGFIFLLLVIFYISFEWLERFFGLLGLMMVVFTVAAVYLETDWHKFALGFVPNVPPGSSSDILNYAYFGVALMSSIMLPYETYFYAAGAIEDKWKPQDINTNRVIAIIGFSLGSLLAISLVVAGATVFGPRRIEPELPGTAALAPAIILGKWGLLLALGGMFFAFGGAAVETTLSGAYNIAHFFDWPWGKAKIPRTVPRFTVTWIVLLVLATLVIITGVDPVQVVEYSIIFAVVILPLTYWPVLKTANDEQVMGIHRNGRLAWALGWIYLVLITLAAIAALPLMFASHSGQG